MNRNSGSKNSRGEPKSFGKSMNMFGITNDDLSKGNMYQDFYNPGLIKKPSFLNDGASTLKSKFSMTRGGRDSFPNSKNFL